VEVRCAFALMCQGAALCVRRDRCSGWRAPRGAGVSSVPAGKGRHRPN
jgi:hypothetical protein